MGLRTQRATIVCAPVVGTGTTVVRLRGVEPPHHFLGSLRQKSPHQIHLLRDVEAPEHSLVASVFEEALPVAHFQMEKGRERDSEETLI